MVFEVTIDAGPERRVFDEWRRAAPLWLVVKTDLGLGRSTWRMSAKFCRETPRGREGKQSAACSWIRRSAARQRNVANASLKTTGMRQRR
ncbi:MAG: hypothetical protein ACO2PN_09215 [Pyrobaculum sp.]